MNKAKQEIIELLKKETKLKEINLEIPPDPVLGDYAFPCFQLSKDFKKNPIEIAMNLAKTLKPTKLIKEIREVGPYLNFFINKQALASNTIKQILKEKEEYGKGKKKTEKVMVEYLGPNTNKSLHLGHLRNGALGLALINILNFNGYEVIKVNINNDRGVGVSEAMLGYKKFFDGKEPDTKPDKFIGKCYVEFKKAEKQNPELEKEATDLVKKWEQGDKETIDLWKKLMKWVYQGYKETYKKFGISFDKEYNESDFYKKAKDTVMEGLKKGLFKKEEGAIMAPLEKYKLPNKILIKSDGTSLYMTQDIYLAKLRYEDFKMDRMIYVVASEQDNHFRQLFKILELLKFKFAKKCHHLSYGMVFLPEGKMKSREGIIIEADDLIEEMTELAKKEIKKRHKDLSEKEIDKRAEIIALGAIKFYMQKFDNVTPITYDPKEAISFEGETGPYIQYAHARISSILKKHNKKVTNEIKPSVLNTDEDAKLVFLLTKFPEIIEQAAESYRPHLFARYLLDLAQAFNEFYHACPILQSDEDTKKARLNLILAVQQVLKNGLNLLGIEAPEAM
ncbi:arginine--tRNA ligase [Candidatus Woesearchaeota archaeon]|nr:arginine--tRNA ligase [Candidatus Woesearchaeota archaeon]